MKNIGKLVGAVVILAAVIGVIVLAVRLVSGAISLVGGLIQAVLGIAVLAELAQKAAAMFPDADIEIVETHHNQKLDVPSGTALLLANGIKAVRPEAEFVIGRHENGKRTKQQIGIHSLRLGSETGTHEILISTGSETLTLTHRAENRALFAEGALRAASWLMGKPAGLYAMRDLIGG